MSYIEDVVKHLIALLRYFAPPIVAIIIVWILDYKHDVLKSFLVQHWSVEGVTFSFWPLILVIFVFGLLVYFTHRTAFHPIVTMVIVCLATMKGNHKPSVSDLAFERWRRRGAAGHTPERSVQTVLDEANAAGHFFYCSFWATLLLTASFNYLLSESFSYSRGIWVSIIVIFFILGLCNDWQTVKLDLKAYNQFRNRSYT